MQSTRRPHESALERTTSNSGGTLSHCHTRSQRMCASASAAASGPASEGSLSWDRMYEPNDGLAAAAARLVDRGVAAAPAGRGGSLAAGSGASGVGSSGLSSPTQARSPEPASHRARR